jgi:hypothetical protein
MNIPPEVTAISRLPNDFDKFKALFILLDTDFKVIENSIYCEDTRYDFGPKSRNLTNIQKLH